MTSTPGGSSSSDSATVALARELIRRPSVTPDDAGCQALIGERLERHGFTVEHMRFGNVDNLYARRGSDGPLLVFAGHTDVVPTGNPERWSSPPFEADIVDGAIIGRGAADMKGGVAAMITALERFVSGSHSCAGSLGVLLTSDEEGPAVDGTVRVMETLAARGERIDWCVLGEPSSSAALGDTIRIGRRGSLGAKLIVRGTQGHVAYPNQADNPVHRAAPFIAELIGIVWDAGDLHFPPTTLQISNIAAGTGATNVIPGELQVDFNLRYSPASPAPQLRERIVALADEHGLDARFTWLDSAQPFLTAKGRLVEAMRESIREVTGRDTVADTGGGTSDGRFIAPGGTELVEFGPINATIHSIDERVDVNELDSLSSIHERLIHRLLGSRDPVGRGGSST